MQYSLKIKEKEELKVKSLDTGSFMHEIINLFFEELNTNNLNIKNIQYSEVEEIVDKIINEKLEDNKYYIRGYCMDEFGLHF